MKKVISVLLCLIMLIGALAINVGATAADIEADASSNSLVMWALLIVGVLLIAAAVAIVILVVLRKKDSK